MGEEHQRERFYLEQYQENVYYELDTLAWDPGTPLN